MGLSRLLLAGLVSDIFDGVLARRWKTSTPALRRFDSTPTRSSGLRPAPSRSCCTPTWFGRGSPAWPRCLR
ncbi:MAG: hypothetical protein WDO13_05100 [Verrucomicrobiota bacterium]